MPAVDEVKRHSERLRELDLDCFDDEAHFRFRAAISFARSVGLKRSAIFS